MRRARELASNAELVSDVGRRLLELAEVKPGMDLLDVPCGTGNAAIPAAQAGARAIGLDPYADMLAVARERAADLMVEVDWVQADLEELPFREESFDRVLSVFAPDGEPADRELRRVCRAGGAIALATWATESPPGAAGVERGTIDWQGRPREYVLSVVRR
jgi:ubiquinone/menaquinone biosynthesis C-methylase UbiE